MTRVLALALAAAMLLPAAADAHSRAHKKHPIRANPRVLPVPLPRPRSLVIIPTSPFEGQEARFWYWPQSLLSFASMCHVEVVQAPAPAGNADASGPAPLNPSMTKSLLATALALGLAIGGVVAIRYFHRKGAY